MKRKRLKPIRLSLFTFFCILFICVSAYGGAIKDTESASHVDTAATQVSIASYDFDGVKILQFNLSVLSHYSYMVISGKDALVVDPDRDIQVYIDTAKKEGWNIRGVFLTHSHADFVAGHTEFSKTLGCPVYQNKDSGALYKIVELSDDQIIDWGEIKIKFLATPGHTPDGMCALVFSKSDTSVPKAILTGDTLFVGSIGRPDLMGGTMAAATLAAMSFNSWNTKLSKLDDKVVVLPAHGAGSLCGAHLRDEPSSTIGMERSTNPYILHKGKNDFITAVLEGLPEAPQYFKHNAKMNREGPLPVSWDEKVSPPPAYNQSLSDISKFYIVDLRDAKSFAAGHIPNAVNIGLRGRLETWVGIMVPWGSELILCGSDEEIKEAAFRLHRVGYTVKGALTFEKWEAAIQQIYKNESVSPLELHKRITENAGPMIIDVRLPNEWMGLRIGNVVNMPLNRLSELSSKLDPGEPVVTVCNSAYRSSLGIGLLERKGFTKVASMEGGGEAWIAAGLPVIQPVGPGSVSAVPRNLVKLPDRIDPSELKRMLMDLPGTFDLVDIRPPDHFKDYNLPGSRNVDIGDLITNPAYLMSAGPLVIVDRDGSLAMAAGGVLSQKTDRPIKVLFGGLDSYWKKADMGEPVKAVPISPSTPGTPKPLPAEPSQTVPQKPETPKKKSAGC
ncbi:MBL fold metallo-hydrolase [Desulfonema ishimotonii]|uniref:MBL fold metallo-hydrolase n=1 Tax=Desulfonema ishimotonii TaxID=45657 RepID=A0A401FW08_9BACT|nr:rhodanese-like domain-containing protein [Desulfonema ishimotonii]GBC61157.1 MBL fold metallo-hydrolase [Desulfonema ishimotonii]